MLPIPVLQEWTIEPRIAPGRGKPIIQFKELEPDWERYNAWRASLIESYANWLKRRKQFHLDETEASTVRASRTDESEPGAGETRA